MASEAKVLHEFIGGASQKLRVVLEGEREPFLEALDNDGEWRSEYPDLWPIAMLFELADLAAALADEKAGREKDQRELRALIEQMVGAIETAVIRPGLPRYEEFLTDWHSRAVALVGPTT